MAAAAISLGIVQACSDSKPESKELPICMQGSSARLQATSCKGTNVMTDYKTCCCCFSILINLPETSCFTSYIQKLAAQPK